MSRLTRRSFVASAIAAGTIRSVPRRSGPQARPILTLVYDKSLGMMRAVERMVFR